MRNNYTICLLVIIATIFIRASFLEYTDLVDPTEARYASVAQEMYLSGDWLTPKLPMPGGIEPYMGKPPFHFWLTALSYSIFGVDEWTARLPSLFGGIALLLIVYAFAKRFFDRDTAYAAVLVVISSVMFYLLAGGSVTDVTLTALISGAIYFLYSFVTQARFPYLSMLSSVILAACAFLTKGPIALVLIALPFFLWSAFLRDFAWLKRIPWVLCIGCFLLITAPWFILSERANPGFLKYFFWNENIARYLFKDYGDLYGSGHRHTYGMSWLMVAGAFLPWTFVLLIAGYLQGVRASMRWIAADPARLFAFCWALSATLFFTFVRQLHFMYVLPSIPGLGLLTAMIIAPSLARSDWGMRRIHFQLVAGIWVLLLVAATILKFSVVGLLLGISLAAFIYFPLKKMTRLATGLGQLACVAGFIAGSYSIVLASFSPYVNNSRSAEPVLEEIATTFYDPKHTHRVGVVTKNSFSHYWAANAWEVELTHEVDVQFVSPDDIAAGKVCFVIFKGNSAQEVPEKILSRYTRYNSIGEWTIFKLNEEIGTTPAQSTAESETSARSIPHQK